MKLQRLLIPSLCLVASSSIHAMLGDNGLDAYREGNYIAAVDELKDQDKDPVVNYYMGLMRLYGYGQLKNTASALRYVQNAADKGFLPAQQLLARYALLEKRNQTDALYWFKKASDANDIQAQMYCAAAYLFGLGVQKNDELAKRYYIAAAKGGNSLAQYTLAQSFIDSRDASNKKLGLIWLMKAVEKNNPAAQATLGEMYAQGKMVPVDLEKAKALINLSIAQGYIPGMVKMGDLMRQQNDIKLAKEWYTKAMDAHYSPAAIALSKLYTDEKSPLYDLHLGFLAMLNAAQNRSKEAQQALVLMYKNGQGVDKNENLAKDWQAIANESAKNNPALAEVHAAEWLSQGKVKTLAAAGFHLRGILSDWNNPDALKQNIYNQPPQMQTLTRERLYKPKLIMSNPNDIPISAYYDALSKAVGNANTPTAIPFPRYPLTILTSQAVSSLKPVSRIKKLERRAILGDTTAQFSIAQLYQEGHEVTKNIPEAIKYYELATAQQDLRAEYNLGLMYLEGKGLPADYQKGMTLLRDAAFKGNEYAQFALACIYEQGYQGPAGELVVQPDLEQAMGMYYLASANDYGPAQYRLAEMLVRGKDVDVADMSVAGRQKRNQMVKQLYQGAFKSGVVDAGLPLAFFNAMDQDKVRQADAFEVAKKAANSGNAVAALLLGLMYDRGIATEVNQEMALTWYQKASTTPVGAFLLGTYMTQGIGVRKDVVEGKALLQKAADAGFSYAYLNLAVMSAQNKEDFLPTLSRALALGNSTAGLLLADYYLSLGNDEKQMQQARDIYQHLAEKGDKDGQLKLGYMFNQGLGGAIDLTLAEKWYRLAAEQGQPVAQYLLGNLNQLGHLGSQPDYAEAKKWYSRAQSTYAPAAVALGFIHDTVDDDYLTALIGYQKAADQGDPIGQFDLGLLYEKGKGLPVDMLKAKDLYQKAADQGHVQAMVQLAGLYFNESSSFKDQDLALALYKKAADWGDRDALYQLGLLSETGVATKLDFPEALQYYQKAADKGNAKAMLALARIYQYGLGVTKNSQEAIQYYKKLAAMGNAYAEYQLAMFYYDGIDGKRMPQEGRQLLLRAEANGSLQAGRVLQWQAAQAEPRKSYIEPPLIAQTPIITKQPVDMMYLNALNEWNRGDERSSRIILDRILTQYPHYEPAKRAYDQMNQQFMPSDIS